MALLLKESTLFRRALPLSVKAWQRMVEEGLAPEKSELLRGVIVEKMPKSILHIQLVSQLLQMLQAMLGAAFWVRPEASLTLADSEPEPDISVVPGKLTDYRQHPNTAKLVVEVAVSSVADDRELASMYAEAEVEEYWIVNAAARSIEVYRHPEAGTYRTQRVYSLGDAVECGSLPKVRMEVAKLFEGL